MKKVKLIKNCIVSIFFISNTILVFILFRELELLTKVIVCLKEKTNTPHVTYNLHIEKTSEILKRPDDLGHLIQAESREQDTTLSKTLISLNDYQARINTDFPRNYNFSCKTSLIKNPSLVVVTPAIFRIEQTPPPVWEANRYYPVELNVTVVVSKIAELLVIEIGALL